MPSQIRNHKRSLVRAVIAALVYSGSHLPAQAVRASDAVVAIRNVNVVPMDTERMDVNQTVILRGAAIERVGPAQRTVVPRGATVKDAGSTLYQACPTCTYTSPSLATRPGRRKQS